MPFRRKRKAPAQQGLVRAFRGRPEAFAQERVVAWLRFYGVMCAHFANGGARGPNPGRTGALLARMGVSKGAPDLVIFDKPPAKPWLVGHAFEMKASKRGRLTAEQAAWLEALEARSWAVAVYHGAEDAIFHLTRLGYHRIGKRPTITE